MLVSFSFKNFASYRDNQEFSLIADEVVSSTHRTKFNACPNIVPIVAIYGANASGKSNLIEAMSYMQSFTVNGFTKYKPTEQIDLLSFFSSKEASEFDVTYLHEDALYQYGFSVDSQRVLEEWLYITSLNGERQTSKTLLEREYNQESGDYDYKPASLKKSWKTRENALSLAAAAYDGNEDAKKAYEWFLKHWRILGNSNKVRPTFTMEQCKKKECSHKIESLMKKADFGIQSFHEEEIDAKDIVFPDEMPEDIKRSILSDLKKTVVFAHKSRDGQSAFLPLQMESSGTQIFFGLAGPLIDILDRGYTLVVDELDRSLHPHLVMEIMNLFNSKDSNPNGAQLIFTSHNSIFMNELNRDEIWVAEKNEFGESEIIPILSYKPRAETSFDKNYNLGRYGGIPHIVSLLADE